MKLALYSSRLKTLYPFQEFAVCRGFSGFQGRTSIKSPVVSPRNPLTSGKLARMEHIYTPPGYDTSYPSLLRAVYDVNSLLKKDGIMAPSTGSLCNTRRVYELIDRPLDSIPVVHVGGTNGKGSTSFKIAECLHRSGVRTGLFVSPHLSSYRERVQVDGALVSEEELLTHMPQVLALCAANSVPLTLFELTFIYACLQFKASGCQAVVLEVGVGGELDATNVVKTRLSIICSVSLDHTRILGSTVEEIATKKGGIFKQGVDALVGPGCPMDVLRRIAAERGANLHELESQDTVFSAKGTEGGAELIDTDALNADISRKALVLLRAQGNVFASLEPDSENIQLILRQSRPPCRWEVHHVTVPLPRSVESIEPKAASTTTVKVVLDVGHNPAAVGALMKRIKRDFVGRNVHVLYAMSRDKDVRTCLRSVLAATPYKRIHFAQSSNFRAISKDDLAVIFRQETGEELPDLEAATSWLTAAELADSANVQLAESAPLRETMIRLFALAASEGEESVVVICGTGYIMPDARELIGIKEPRDDRDLLCL